jgi:hypothetical protein
MPLLRMLAPAGPATTTTRVNGRAYTGTPGTPIDVPDFDAFALEANGWLTTALHGVGTTAARPLNPFKGMVYLDTTLAVPIKYDGANWRNQSSGASV